MAPRAVPELLAPAGCLDAVRAAVANGANAVYLGAGAFNARDEAAQLSLADLAAACALAHSRAARVYLTLNTLIKPAELVAALELLGEAVDRGIDAVIVQDVGLIDLIRSVYPGLAIHGSTQMTVHDVTGAASLRAAGVARVVLARENTLDDVRAIRAAVPDLELETFVHGALCIAYSGQCLMSGLIAERSANRGSCAQSCRKDYRLADADSGETLDVGYLISAKDLAAVEHLVSLADAGVVCLKIEGRKKRPEYVATVTRSYRTMLDGLAAGGSLPLAAPDALPLVQIFSRGATGGMLGGRQGRAYITRDRPDNRGSPLGMVVGVARGELLVDVTCDIRIGDGLAFEPPDGARADHAALGLRTGFAVLTVRTLSRRPGTVRQAIATRTPVPIGWRVVRTADAERLAAARASYDAIGAPVPHDVPVHVAVDGRIGQPLIATWTAGAARAVAVSAVPLAPASHHALDAGQLKTYFGRLGGTAFGLARIEGTELAPGCFLPVSELNRMRQRAIADLTGQRARDNAGIQAGRAARIARASGAPSATLASRAAGEPALTASVYRVEDARAAAAAGATEVVFDPFLRNPPPPATRVGALARELAASGVRLLLRTPTIVRPSERRALGKWLALETPLVTGHVGLARELAGAGRAVVLDYAANCFNAHTAAHYFGFGIERLVLSVELTTAEIAAVVAPWRGRGFAALVYGRPEGMTLEHCVLSAAFDRAPTTCRDLCVQAHPNVALTDPAGYTFAVATDSACRNRLLHSRPIEGSEYLPALWAAGVRAYHLIFNVPGDPIGALVGAYATQMRALTAGDATAVPGPARRIVGTAFTRGHYARAV